MWEMMQASWHPLPGIRHPHIVMTTPSILLCGPCKVLAPGHPGGGGETGRKGSGVTHMGLMGRGLREVRVCVCVCLMALPPVYFPLLHSSLFLSLPGLGGGSG